MVPTHDANGGNIPAVHLRCRQTVIYTIQCVVQKVCTSVIMKLCVGSCGFVYLLNKLLVKLKLDLLKVWFSIIYLIWTLAGKNKDHNHELKKIFYSINKRARPAHSWMNTNNQTFIQAGNGVFWLPTLLYYFLNWRVTRGQSNRLQCSKVQLLSRQVNLSIKF